MKIDKKLLTWQEKALISASQRQAILQYEAAHSHNNHWFLYGFLLLGAVVTGIGIISLIAANWNDIPDWLKLCADFIGLSLLGTGIFYLHKQQPESFWTELLFVSFQLLCLASIGLISQIYHSGGMWYHALLIWSIITFPIMLYAQRHFASFLWSSLFLLGFVWSLVEFQYQLFDIQAKFWDFENKLSMILLMTPLLSVTLAYFAKHYHYKALSHNLYAWFTISALSSLVFADIFYWFPFNDWKDGYLVNASLFMPIYLIAALLSGLILFSRNYKVLSKGVLLLALALLLLLYHPHILISGDDQHSLIAPILIITILILYSLHLGMSEQQLLFNLITFLIGLRFLIIYFDVIGSLAATGVGLIISGILIIAISYGWYRARRPVQIWIGSLK
jgi:uncharacterized membrane protein